MGTSKAVKKPEEKNRLLEALDKADPDKFKTIRMLVEVGKLRKTAKESSTNPCSCLLLLRVIWRWFRSFSVKVKM
jgi:hypothetical protein